MPPRRSARLALLPSPERERGQGLLDLRGRERRTRTVPVPVRDECDDCDGPCLAAPPGLDEYVAQNCSFARREWNKLLSDSDYLRDKSSRIIFRTFARDCFERSLVEHCKSSRYRAVTWLMHLVHALPESERESFFRTAFCTSSYPKTSAKLARDVDLLEFVFKRQMNDFTLEDVKFAHGILGQDFKPSEDHLIKVNAFRRVRDNVRYLKELLANSDGNAPGGTETVDALRRAQIALDDVSDHIPEGAYLQTTNALGEAHRRVRPRRDDD